MSNERWTRIRFSFRTKLFLALSILVILVLGFATTVFEREAKSRIEKRFQDEYQSLTKLIDQQFSVKLQDLKNNLDVLIESNSQLKTTLTTAAISSDNLGLSQGVNEQELLKDVHLRLASSVPFTSLFQKYEWLMFLNPQGKLLYSSIAKEHFGDDLMSRNLIRPLIEEDIELAVWSIDAQKEIQEWLPAKVQNYLVFSLPIFVNEQFYGLVLVGETMEKIHAWLPKIRNLSLVLLSKNQILTKNNAFEATIDWSKVMPNQTDFQSASGFFLAKKNIFKQNESGFDIGLIKDLFEEKMFLSELRHLSLYVLLGGVLLAFILSFWMVRGISRPVARLASIAREVGRGHFDIDTNIRSGDEFEALGEAFHDMATGLKERDFLKNTFECYVSKEVAQAVMKDPSLLKLGGERREITVLFVDLAGFTSFSENVAAGEVFDLLNAFFGVVTEEVLKFHGTLNQYQGDAVLAFWGAPLKQKEHAQLGLSCALAMKKALMELSIHWQAQGLPKMGFRIGVNSGHAMVGNVGTSERFNFTAHGDDVNLASRIESANKHYGTSLLVTDLTLKSANGSLKGRMIDQVRVVGRQEPLWLYEPWIANDVALKERYESAHAFYQEGRFDQAEILFAEILESTIQDGPSQAMLARCQEFKNKPPQNWDGIFNLISK